ncbi:Ulp1 peptidase [Trifolium repens]|nr:Ulp1 peptidase [Trifolium repens]
MLETYNWGGAVHQFLVDSITRIAGEYAKCGATEIVVSGCSAVLQIWVLEHLSSFTDSTKSFSRIIKWTNLTKCSVTIENILFKCKAILTQQQRLLGENNEFREIISRLEAEIKLLKDDKGVNFAKCISLELPHFRGVGITMTESSSSKLLSNHVSLHEDPIKIMRHCNLVSVQSHLII